MSTKTIKQRIALVAVSALTAGVLSVIAAPAANASAVTYAANTAVPAAGELRISTTASTTGAAVTGNTTPADLGKASLMTSLGWVSKTSTGGTAGTGMVSLGNNTDVTASGVVLAGAKISFAIGGLATANAGKSVTVTGGNLSDIRAAGASTPAYQATVVNGAATAAFHDASSTDASQLVGVFNITAAVGSTATLTVFEGANVDGISTATNGDLVGSWTFTVAAADAAGVVNAANTVIAQQAGIAAGVAASTVLTYDTASRMTNGQVGIVYVDIYDAYLSNVTTGTFTASTTAGTVNAVVAGSAASSDSYAATTTFDSVANSSGKFYVYVNQPVANTAGSSTVTMSLNGQSLGSKTLTWQGQAASITVNSTSSKIFANGYAAYSSGDAKNLNINYTIKDAAGNNVTVTTYPTLSDQTGSMVGASLSPATDVSATTATLAGVLTNLDVDAFAQTSSNGVGLATMRIPSSTLNGAGSYTLSFTNASGATIKSTVQNATVSRGATNTFTASWDKASYAPGEIAKLTIKGVDAFGNAIADGTAATGLVRSVNSSGFTQVGTALSAASTFSGGEITENYAVGNTEGAYSFSVTLTSQSGQSPAVGTLAIKASTATVSNADVLKSIVALIASINKQIQALQKLILRR
jgi:trimeric autotransporter adhesin